MKEIKCKCFFVPIDRKPQTQDICRSNLSGAYGFVEGIKIITNVCVDCPPYFLLPKKDVVTQQLIIVSDEGSKEGEWTMFSDTTNGFFTKANYPTKANGDYASNGIYNFKVIAAYPELDKVAKIKTNFIKEYLYNNCPKEVIVEYNDETTFGDEMIEGVEVVPQVAIDSDGYIKVKI